MTITQYETLQSDLSVELRKTIENQISNLNQKVPEITLSEFRRHFKIWRLTVSTQPVSSVIDYFDHCVDGTYRSRLDVVSYKLDDLRVKIIRVKRDLGRWFVTSRIGAPRCQPDLESIFGASRMKALLK